MTGAEAVDVKVSALRYGGSIIAVASRESAEACGRTLALDVSICMHVSTCGRTGLSATACVRSRERVGCAWVCESRFIARKHARTLFQLIVSPAARPFQIKDFCKGAVSKKWPGDAVVRHPRWLLHFLGRLKEVLRLLRLSLHAVSSSSRVHRLLRIVALST